MDGNVLIYDALNTFYLQLYVVGIPELINVLSSK